MILLPAFIFLLFLVVIIFPFFGGFDIIFRHYRVGKDGKIFFMYKIRSLNHESEIHPNGNKEVKQLVIPKIGFFLRRYRLDELPQIWNILRGDMSWVGPRPEQVNFVEEYKNKCENYSNRHLVRPGITGLAQIHNPDATRDDYREKLPHDLEYIETASLWLDIQILWKSLVVVFRN
jgi:lipopolysaccharide/colanic/teichoic acid biosynthesis glycosyltransferase